MVRLTLRTLLAYIDDTLDPATASELGKKVAASEEAQALIERIKKVTRRRGIMTPPTADETADPNVVAAYLDNALASDGVKDVERTALESDPHLAEIAACHQILTLILTEPVRVPPRAHQRMYGLVPAPAGDPARQPNKALPVGGAAPPAGTDADATDTDAALLFGMKRYSASTPWAERVLLFGVAAVLALMLTVGAFVSLSRERVKPPEVGAGDSFAALPPAPVEPKPKEPEPPAPKPEEKPKEKEPEAKPKDKEPDPPAKPKDKDPDPLPLPKPKVQFDPVQKPNNGAVGKEPVGRVAPALNEAGRGVAVALRGGLWVVVRAKEAGDVPLFAGQPVMALPGYKATATFGAPGAELDVHLWGNLPDQAPIRAFEARVTPHLPPAGFAADLTLHTGRIYLKPRAAVAPMKVRVRTGGEVWDVTLADAKSEVFVELISWFDQKTPFAPQNGETPRLDGRVVGVSDSARVVDPLRAKELGTLQPRAAIAWDSVKGTGAEPVAVPVDERLARDAPFDALPPADLADALAKLAADLTPKEGAPNLIGTLGQRLKPLKGESAAARAAVFAFAALAGAEQDENPALVALADLLTTADKHWTTEHALVTALAGYVGRDLPNTAALHRMLTRKLNTGADGATAFVALARGFVNPNDPNPERVEQLLNKDKGAFIGDKDPAVQAAARWHLLALDQKAWVPRAADPARRTNAALVKELQARFGAPKK
jgi:hypothetical protein